MNILGFIDLLGNLFFLASMLASGVFMFLYGFRSNWRATEAGRVIMWFMATVSVILFMSVFFALGWPNSEHPVRVVFRLLAFGFLFVAILRLILSLLKEQSKQGVDSDSEITRP